MAGSVCPEHKLHFGPFENRRAFSSLSLKGSAICFRGYQARTGGYQHYVTVSTSGQTRTFIITKQDLPTYPQNIATTAPYGGFFRLLHQIRPMK